MAADENVESILGAIYEATIVFTLDGLWRLQTQQAMQEIVVLLIAVYVLALQISGAIDQTCSSFAQRTWRRL